jgi:hypothetical protein
MVLRHIITKNMRSSGIGIPDTTSVVDERDERVKKPKFGDSLR